MKHSFKKKESKKIVVLLLIMAVFLVPFSCSEKGAETLQERNFHALTIGGFRGSTQYFKDSFIEENSTRGLFVETIDGIAYYDTTSPESRAFIVKNKAQADDIFSELPEVDFERQMIVVVMYTSRDNSKHYCKNVYKEGTLLKVEMEFSYKKRTDGRDATKVQPIFIIIMDRLDDITEVEVVLNKI